MQTADDPQTRTYLDFNNPSQAWDSIVRLFEERLKLLTPGVKNITYDVQDLFRFIDTLTDISCMMCVPKAPAACHGVACRAPMLTHSHNTLPTQHLPRSLDKATKKYDAHSRDFIKSSILAHLQRQASGGGGGGGSSGGGRRQ